MQLVEQHIIKWTDPRFQRIDEAAFASKNLWNAANYLVRQSFIFEGKYLNHAAVFNQIKSRSLSSPSSQGQQSSPSPTASRLGELL